MPTTAVAVVGKEQEWDEMSIHPWGQCGLRGISTRVDEIGVPIQSVSGLLREPSIQLLTLVVEQSAPFFTQLRGGRCVDCSQ